MTRAAAVVFGVAIVAVLAFIVWPEQGFRSPLALHFANGEAYAALRIEHTGTLPDALFESSGVAVSRTQPGVLWSHNDSGDAPVLYAIDASGRLLATVPIAGAAAVDWEDIAAGPCPGSARPGCLYVADTGDNTRTRTELSVYVVEEPAIAHQNDAARRGEVVARSIRFRYPDEPHDAEALAIGPDGDVLIVSKGRTGAVDVFGLSAERVAAALTTGAVLTAEHRARTAIVPDERIGRHVSGAALSPDGTTLAIRTYNEVFFYAASERPQGGTTWIDLGRPCFLGDREPQGEAIDYLDERALVLTSERAAGPAGPIHRVECR